MKLNYEKEALEAVQKGHNLLFTSKSEAEGFIIKNKLTSKLIEESLTDDEHFKIKGYKSNLYWLNK